MGDAVTTILNVRPANTGGLDFRGCGQNASGIMPGSSTILLFNADRTCSISVYRPSGNVVVYTLDVVVIEAPTSVVYGSGNTTPSGGY